MILHCFCMYNRNNAISVIFMKNTSTLSWEQWLWQKGIGWALHPPYDTEIKNNSTKITTERKYDYRKYRTSIPYMQAPVGYIARFISRKISGIGGWIEGFRRGRACVTHGVKCGFWNFEKFSARKGERMLPGVNGRFWFSKKFRDRKRYFGKYRKGEWGLLSTTPNFLVS